DAADAITVDRFRASDLRVDRKPDRTPVTDADLAVEDTIRELLGDARPADRVAGEERGGLIDDADDADSNAAKSNADRCWLLDPIDGTKNFLRGVDVWATLIALLVDGVPAVGVISAPALARRWYAVRGGGAWLANSVGAQRLSVSKVSTLDDAYLSTTDLASWSEYRTRDEYLRLVDACWQSRAFGDFWQHCLVAEGVIDIAVEPVVSPWDVAAVRVLVTEAGGTFTDLAGRPRHDGGSALSTNGRLHRAALDVLHSANSTDAPNSRP
ncbi:MAG: histidinol-phosphatase, partial [Sciscionella sp.]|nr:histidinol-phosphatase [Sciscionella sp.]